MQLHVTVIENDEIYARKIKDDSKEHNSCGIEVE